MPTIYCVHELTEGNKFGSTTDIDTIISNMNLLDNGFKDYVFEQLKTIKVGDSFKHFSAAGRYVVYLEVSKDFENCLMEFSDIEGYTDDSNKLSEISFRYINKFDELSHLDLWNKFIEMEKSFLFNKDAVELKIC